MLVEQSNQIRMMGVDDPRAGGPRSPMSGVRSQSVSQSQHGQGMKWQSIAP